MNNEVKVSIVVPIYNVEKYLSKCIDSLINQTLKDIEIILVNDGSTDGSLDICNEYILKDSRIKLVNKKNGGLSDARNIGIDNCTGKYLLFIDSDDWCETNMIECLYNSITKYESDISICGYSIDYNIDRYKIEKNFISEKKYIGREEICDGIYTLDKNGMFNVVWNKLYNLKIIKDNNLKFEKDGMPGEDLIFNTEYFKYIKSIIVIDKILYHYIREDNETLVSKYKKNLHKKVKLFNNCRKSLYEFYGMTNKKYVQCYGETYIGYMFICIPNLYRKNSNLNQKEKINILKTIINDIELREFLNIIEYKSFHIKLFSILIKTRSAYLVNSIYTVLFILRNKFTLMYKILRTKIIKTENRS